MFRLKAEVTHAAWGHAAYTISIVGRVTDPAHSLKCPKFWVIPHDLSLKAFSLQSIFLSSYEDRRKQSFYTCEFNGGFYL